MKKMLNFQRDPYAITHEERDRGRGMYAVHDDDGELQKMDEAEDTIVNNQYPILDIATFPATTNRTAIVYENDGHEFHFDPLRVPATFHSVLPGAMLGMKSYTKITAKHKAGVCFQPTLPFVVHASPVVSLFQLVFVGERANFVPEQMKQKHKFRSFMSTVSELQYLKLAIVNSFIPFHVSFTPNTIPEMAKYYDAQVVALENRTNCELDELYEKGGDRNAFIDICRRHAFTYIHLLEAFIYGTTIGPHDPTGMLLPFESIMTPMIEADDASQNEAWLEDAVAFFRHKHEHQTPPELIQKIEWNTLRVHVERRDEPIYRGLIPQSILDQYIFLMRDGK